MHTGAESGAGFSLRGLDFPRPQIRGLKPAPQKSSDVFLQ